MNGRPTTTVVIPTCGRPESLRDTLSALARQEFRNFEVVVVDDGSPDQIRAEHLPEQESFACRLVRQNNAGPAAARNRGVQEARGDIIAFTDDDCRPQAGWLSAMVGEISQHSDALVGTLTCNGLRENTWSATSQLIIDLVYAHFNADPANAYFLASNNLACRRALFLELGGFDSNFAKAGAEDREFCDRWRMRRWPIRLINRTLVEHHHAQTFRRFLELHYRYGRGAYLYQRKRRERKSGTIKDDLGFHRSLLRLLPKHLPPQTTLARKIQLCAGLALWQLANAAGFFASKFEFRPVAAHAQPA